MLSPRHSISNLAREMHIEEMRGGDWVTKLVRKGGMMGTHSGMWVDRFISLNDHVHKAWPRLEWVKPSPGKKSVGNSEKSKSHVSLKHIADVRIGLPEGVSSQQILHYVRAGLL